MRNSDHVLLFGAASKQAGKKSRGTKNLDATKSEQALFISGLTVRTAVATKSRHCVVIAAATLRS